MSPFTDARMHLGIELGGAGAHPAAARWSGLDPVAAAGLRHHLALVLAAARRGLDFVSLPGPDAPAMAARLAPLVGGIGLVPTVPVDGQGAASAPAGSGSGWEPVPAPADPTGAGERWQRVAATIEEVARLRADSTVRAIGSAGPLLVLRADEPEALPVAARHADVVRIAAAGLDAAHHARDRVRTAIAAAGRDPDEVAVMLDVEVHLAGERHRARTELVQLDALDPAPDASLRVVGTPGDLADLVGATLRLAAADGITLRPLVLPADLRRIAVDAVPVLAGRGLLRPGWSGLRRPAASAPAWRKASA